MKTIDAGLLAAMQDHRGVAVAYLRYRTFSVATGTWGSLVFLPLKSYSFTKDSLRIELLYDDSEGYPTPQYSTITSLQIDRGLVIGNAEYTVTSPIFYLYKSTIDTRSQTVILEGATLPNYRALNITADQPAEDVITDILAVVGVTPEFLTTEPWQSWNFFAEDTISMNNMQSLASLLYQKYLVETLPGTSGPVFTNPAFYIDALTPYEPSIVIPSSEFSRRSEFAQPRYFVWKDETGAVHSSGSASNPVHNLGFIPSSIADGEVGIMNNYRIQEAYTWIRPDLRLENGDTFSSDPEEPEAPPFWIEEHYKPGSNEPWYQVLHIIEYPRLNTSQLTTRGSTESITLALNTSKFDGILSERESQIQSAMDVIDDHTHDYEDITQTHAVASSVTLNAGTSTSSLSDLQTINDGNLYSITEATGVPGISLRVDFSNIVSFARLSVSGYYVGGATHAVRIQLYYWAGAVWHTFDLLMTGLDKAAHMIDVPNDSIYIGTGANAGAVRVRFYHTESGNVSHSCFIDYVALIH